MNEVASVLLLLIRLMTELMPVHVKVVSSSIFVTDNIVNWDIATTKPVSLILVDLMISIIPNSGCIIVLLSLNHVNVGRGIPNPVQVSTTSSVSFTIKFCGVTVTLAGSRKKMKNRLNKYNYHYYW